MRSGPASGELRCGQSQLIQQNKCKQTHKQDHRGQEIQILELNSPAYPRTSKLQQHKACGQHKKAGQNTCGPGQQPQPDQPGMAGRH